MKTVAQRVLWTAPRTGRQVFSDLIWTDTDPLAVRLVFLGAAEDGSDREWQFSLDLISAITGGISLVAGGGDVYTGYERQADGLRLFSLQLSSPDGTVKLTAPLADMLQFVVDVEDKLPADDVLATMVDYELSEMLKEGGV